MVTASIPASLGDDESGEYKAKQGLYENTIVTYEANGAKYIYDSQGVYTKLDAPSSDDGGGGGDPVSAVQSDYAQSDSEADDYIKNRPFYAPSGEGELTFSLHVSDWTPNYSSSYSPIRYGTVSAYGSGSSELESFLEWAKTKVSSSGWDQYTENGTIKLEVSTDGEHWQEIPLDRLDYRIVAEHRDGFDEWMPSEYSASLSATDGGNFNINSFRFSCSEQPDNDYTWFDWGLSVADNVMLVQNISDLRVTFLPGETKMLGTKYVPVDNQTISSAGGKLCFVGDAVTGNQIIGREPITVEYDASMREVYVRVSLGTVIMTTGNAPYAPENFYTWRLLDTQTIGGRTVKFYEYSYK